MGSRAPGTHARPATRHCGKPELTPARRQALIDALTATTQSPAWQEALEKNDWMPAVLAGDEFTKFVESEFVSLRKTMEGAGMVVVPIGWLP